ELSKRNVSLTEECMMDLIDDIERYGNSDSDCSLIPGLLGRFHSYYHVLEENNGAITMHTLPQPEYIEGKPLGTLLDSWRDQEVVNFLYAKRLYEDGTGRFIPNEVFLERYRAQNSK